MQRKNLSTKPAIQPGTIRTGIIEESIPRPTPPRHIETSHDPSLMSSSSQEHEPISPIMDRLLPPPPGDFSISLSRSSSPIQQALHQVHPIIFDEEEGKQTLEVLMDYHAMIGRKFPVPTVSPLAKLLTKQAVDLIATHTPDEIDDIISHGLGYYPNTEKPDQKEDQKVAIVKMLTENRKKRKLASV